MKLASSGEINWNEIDVKPYCGKNYLILIDIQNLKFLEFLDAFRTNSTFQQQDRDKLINLASSFFDYTGITNLARSRIASKIRKYFLLLPFNIFI
jgi:hypothetical protein